MPQTGEIMKKRGVKVNEGNVFKYKNGLSNDFVNRYLVLTDK